MSEFHIISTAAPSPPADVQMLVVDTPDTNILTINQPIPTNVTALANTIYLNGENGIQTYALTSIDENYAQIGFTRDSVQTIGAVTENCLQLLTTTNTCFTLQVLVSGIADNDEAIGGYTTATIKNIAGIVSLVDEPDIITQSDVGLASGTFAINVSGSFVNIDVTGVAGRTINWACCTPGIIEIAK